MVAILVTVAGLWFWRRRRYGGAIIAGRNGGEEETEEEEEERRVVPIGGLFLHQEATAPSEEGGDGFDNVDLTPPK